MVFRSILLAASVAAFSSPTLSQAQRYYSQSPTTWIGFVSNDTGGTLLYQWQGLMTINGGQLGDGIYINSIDQFITVYNEAYTYSYFKPVVSTRVDIYDGYDRYIGTAYPNGYAPTISSSRDVAWGFRTNGINRFFWHPRFKITQAITPSSNGFGGGTRVWWYKPFG